VGIFEIILRERERKRERRRRKEGERREKFRKM